MSVWCFLLSFSLYFLWGGFYWVFWGRPPEICPNWHQIGMWIFGVINDWFYFVLKIIPSKMCCYHKTKSHTSIVQKYGRLFRFTKLRITICDVRKIYQNSFKVFLHLSTNGQLVVSGIASTTKANIWWIELYERGRSEKAYRKNIWDVLVQWPDYLLEVNEQNNQLINCF